MTATTERPRSKKATSGKAESVDPRIRARRIEVQRNEGRRRLRTIALLLAITIMAIGTLALLDSSWLDVDDFEVVGATNADPTRIVNAMGIAVGEPLVEIDLDRAAAGVEAVPWVETATVDRRWNGTVVVEVVEREAVAAIASPDGVVLIDRHLRQLEQLDARPAGFLPVAGLTASGVAGDPAPAGAHAVVRLVEELSPGLAAQISQIVVDEGELYLELEAGGRVRLGSESGLTDKLIGLETMMARVDLRCLFEIDIRVASAPALTRGSAEQPRGAVISDLASCT